MRLTSHTDYALRVLIYLALKPDRQATIREISERYNLSRDHLMKIVQKLGKVGYIETIRGKNGGIRLGPPPETIQLSHIVRTMETNLDLVECHGAAANGCTIAPVCILQDIFHDALEAFFSVLERYTLADLRHPTKELSRLVQLDEKHTKSA